MATVPVIDKRREITPELIAEVKDRLVQALDPELIILFGSQANGTARPGSDLDLLVEVETDKGYLERNAEALGLFGLHLWPLDLIVVTPQEFEQGSRIRGTLMWEIRHEGKVIYERSRQ